jgi:hypothetical protein
MVVELPRPLTEVRVAARLDLHGTRKGQHGTIRGRLPMPSDIGKM